jgi:DNA-binding response OmpR family regulator/predicted transcriptional regulator
MKTVADRGAPAETGRSGNSSSAVLIVDDDPEFLAEAKEALDVHGFVVMTATSAREVYFRIEEASTSIAVVGVDYHLGAGPDGIGLIESLRQSRLIGPHVQFFTMSGQDDYRLAKKSLELGAVALLEKPVSPSRLVSAVTDAFERFRVADAVDRLVSNSKTREVAGEPRNVGSFPAQPSEILRFLHQLEVKRLEVLGEAIDSAAWRVLLEIIIAENGLHPPTVTSVCGSVGLPYATAHRRVQDLLEQGVIKKTPDALDQRRALLSVSPDGRRLVRGYVEAVAKAAAGSLKAERSRPNGRRPQQGNQEPTMVALYDSERPLAS